MTPTNETIEALKTGMQDAAAEAETALFMTKIAAVTQAMGVRHGFDPQMVAYALASVACAVADTAGSRKPVLVALSDSWPELFQEISEEDFDRMRRELDQRKRS